MTALVRALYHRYFARTNLIIANSSLFFPGSKASFSSVAELSPPSSIVPVKQLRPIFRSSESVIRSESNSTSLVDEVTWFGLHAGLRLALSELGITRPTEIQRTAIPELLKGRDALLSASTGTGKTLAYLLPVAHRLKEDESQKAIITREGRPRALIVVPTRELALQVGSVAKRLCHTAKFSCAVLVGGRKEGWQKETLAKRNDMLVATVGRLQKALNNDWLSLADVRFVVIDEADTMLSDISFRRRTEDSAPSSVRPSQNQSSKSGAFASEVLSVLRPVLRSIKEANEATAALAEVTGDARRLALKGGGEDLQRVQVVLAGATIPENAVEAVRRIFPNAQPVTSSCAHRVPTRLQQSFVRIDGDPNSKHDALLRAITDLLNADSSARVLVFCNTIGSARSTGHFLGDQGGYSVASLHGGIPPKLRQSEYELFLSGKCNVLVCTDAAARGLDFPNAQISVVLFDFPLNSVEYLHRAGRAARAGRDGKVISLVGRRDIVLATSIERATKEGRDMSSLSASKASYVPSKQRGVFQAKLEYVEKVRTARSLGLRRPERPIELGGIMSKDTAITRPTGATGRLRSPKTHSR
jgi:superfamily II DNA/RNA helicase